MSKVNLIKPSTRRLLRVRSHVRGTGSRPRLSVFRSNLHTNAQLIDDKKGITLLGLSSKDLKAKGSKLQLAQALGQALADLALKKGIKTAVFDRGSYRFHGRVKAVADAAREAGLKI